MEISISTEYFEVLVRDSQKLEMLLNVIFDNASLSYRKCLRVDDEAISVALKMIDHSRYLFTMKELEAKENKDA